MTDKEKIIAEIERLMKWKPKAIPSGMRQRDVLNIRKGVLLILKDFINSLPAAEEQPSEDLEEEIKRKYKSNNALMMPIEDFRKLVLHFTNWQKEQMMKSAVDATCVLLPPPDVFKVLICHEVTDKLTIGQKVKVIVKEDK